MACELILAGLNWYYSQQIPRFQATAQNRQIDVYCTSYSNIWNSTSIECLCLFSHHRCTTYDPVGGYKYWFARLFHLSLYYDHIYLH